MEFTLDQKKYVIHAINELTKKEGIANAGIGLEVIRMLQEPMQPANGIDKEEVQDDATNSE